MSEIRYPRILPAAECSIIVEFGNEISNEINALISGFTSALGDSIPGIVEVIPTFRSALITYDPRVINYELLCRLVKEKLGTISARSQEKKRIVEIPVCYGGKHGPDLSFVAKHAGLSKKEVIRIHSSRSYLIYMLGFQPGFPYLGGLDPRIFTPRLQSPRTLIPAGSVGIGGEQTGLYPVASPAGWQIIGTTPVRAYNPHKEPAIPYEAGDHIRFVPISEEEFLEIEALEKKNAYTFKVVESE